MRRDGDEQEAPEIPDGRGRGMKRCRIRWDVLCVLLLVFGESSLPYSVLMLMAHLGPICLRYGGLRHLALKIGRAHV